MSKKIIAEGAISKVKQFLKPILIKFRLYRLCKPIWDILKYISSGVQFILGVSLFFLPDIIRFRRIKKKRFKKLVIVSHPDDESLFFSQELLCKEKVTAVFCLTNGYNWVRRREFYRALHYYHLNGYIMKLPDQTMFSFLFNQKNVYRRIHRLWELYSGCESVYTHNPEGEYGHFHHQMIHSIVTETFGKSKVKIPVSRKMIQDKKYLLNQRKLAEKKYIFDQFYTSQADIVQKYIPDYFEHEKLVQALSFR